MKALSFQLRQEIVLLQDGNGFIIQKQHQNLEGADKTAFTDRNMVNLFIFRELDTQSKDLNTMFTLDECLFGTVMLNKNSGAVKHGYSGYGIGFDVCSQFH